MREMVSIGLMKIRKGERIFLAIGLALLAIWAGARIYGSIASRAALNLFRSNTAEAQLAGKSALLKDASLAASGVDFTLWNPKRIAAFKESLLERPNWGSRVILESLDTGMDFSAALKT
jgi:hypothetical protein